MSKPIITLTTDFGLRDPYVASMKGVIYRLAPETTIVDITHEIPPQAIEEAAYTLAQAHGWFPAETIHVAVVDPGVGTARRPLLARAGGHYFIAPDNGLLSPALQRAAAGTGALEVWHCTASQYWLAQRSQTFHGRDVFAPMAAWLARGLEPSNLGKRITDFRRLDLPRPRREGDKNNRIVGVILHQDRFGNLITNLTPRDLEWPAGQLRRWRGHAGQTELIELRDCYEGAFGQVFAIWGSAGWLEISSTAASAAELTGLKRGDEVIFEPTP